MREKTKYQICIYKNKKQIATLELENVKFFCDKKQALETLGKALNHSTRTIIAFPDIEPEPFVLIQGWLQKSLK